MTIARMPSIIEQGGSTIRTDIAGDLIYSGRAIPGSSNADPVWLITRLDATDGGDFPELHPNGIASFTNVWDDRASLTYS